MKFDTPFQFGVKLFGVVGGGESLRGKSLAKFALGSTAQTTFAN